ncbi:MAG: MFS transporter [Candidatus Falkowbacteria bacterium]|nr:MFS transporter [Candidatus Falkowbacteria bacterium]
MKKEQPKTRGNKKKLIILYFLGFIISIASAIPAYSQSSFLTETVGLSLVSTFFLLANILTFAAILLFPKMIKKIKNYRSMRRVIFAYGLALIGLTLAPKNPWLMFAFFGSMNICIGLIAINMDIFVESFASRHAIGTTHTTYFTAMNLGWIISPFIAGQLIMLGGFKLTYAASLVCLMIFAFFFVLQAKNLKDKNSYRDQDFVQTIKSIWRNKKLRSIFFLAFILSVFYSLVVVFLPVYLNEVIGFSWESLGMLFSLMLLPFIFVEIPAGIISDRYLGEKELMSIGFIILSVSLLLCSIVKGADFWLWAIVLIFSRFGAALVESMREAYFFKTVSAQDVDFINFFRATAPLGYVFGALLGGVVLISMPLNQLFLAGAFLMCLSFPVLFFIKDVKQG